MEKALLYDSMPQLLVLCLGSRPSHEDLQRKVSERQGRHRGRVCRKTVSRTRTTSDCQLGKVAMAASGIDTKASAVEKLKKGLDAVKKVATGQDQRDYGAIGGGGDEQQRHHHQIGQVRRRARQQNRDRGSDPQSGKQLLAKGVSGGLIAWLSSLVILLAKRKNKPSSGNGDRRGGRLLQYTRSSQRGSDASRRSRPVSRQQGLVLGAPAGSRGNLCRRSDLIAAVLAVCCATVVSEEEGR
ncbi:hypothetical protein Q5P01_024977 [Channa striata]|uniref:Uncharacterized protein n=1 Tax=Channa striata TaxID=64152 RepID=A0AA88LJE3_CHASR|nr:hypothetical protein Q5P01_024977 [Channa striata]